MPIQANPLRAAAESGSIKGLDHDGMKERLLLQAAGGNKRMMTDMSQVFFTIHAFRDILFDFKSKVAKKRKAAESACDYFRQNCDKGATDSENKNTDNYRSWKTLEIDAKTSQSQLKGRLRKAEARVRWPVKCSNEFWLSLNTD